MRSKKRYTEEEDQVLFDYAGRYSLNTIGKMLNRTELSVYRRMSRLGIGRLTEAQGYLTAYRLAKTLKVDEKTVLKWINKYELPHFRTVSHSVKINILVSTKKFWDWAEENKALLPVSKFEKNALPPEPCWVEEERKLRYKIMPKRTNQKWTVFEDKKLVQLKTQGLTYKQIGSLIGRSAEAAKSRKLKLDNKKVVYSTTDSPLEKIVIE